MIKGGIVVKTRILTFILIALLTFSLCGCSSAGGNTDSLDNWELTQAQLDSLMQQIADDAYPEKEYEKYVPQGVFADAYLFGLDRDGDDGTAYVMLNDGSYVVIKGKAYNNSGGVGEAIIKFKYTDDGAELKETIWSEDGERHEEWIKENFSKSSLKSWKSFGENEYISLQEKVNKKAEEALGVPVETEYTLSIDDEKGTYEVFEAIESGEGEDYTFDTKTIYSGKLKENS